MKHQKVEEGVSAKTSVHSTAIHDRCDTAFVDTHTSHNDAIFKIMWQHWDTRISIPLYKPRYNGNMKGRNARR